MDGCNSPSASVDGVAILPDLETVGKVDTNTSEVGAISTASPESIANAAASTSVNTLDDATGMYDAREFLATLHRVDGEISGCTNRKECQLPPTWQVLLPLLPDYVAVCYYTNSTVECIASVMVLPLPER